MANPAASSPAREVAATTAAAVQPRPWLAALLVASGSLCFSFMGLFIKLAAEHMHTTAFSLMVIRNALGLVLNALVLGFSSGRGSVAKPDIVGSPVAGYKSRRERCGCPTTSSSWRWLSVRCFCGFGAILLEYMALQRMPLAINTCIVYSSPVFIVVWAAVIFRETLKIAVIACIGVCFLGMMCVVQPWHHLDAEVPMWAYVAALAAAVLAGLIYLSLRELKRVSCHVVLNCFMVSSFVLSLATGLALQELPIPPLSSPAWRYLLAVGAAAYGAEVCITLGYARAGKRLGKVSSLKFLSPIFSSIWGLLFLGESLDALQVVGILLVLTSSAMILRAKSSHSEDTEKDYIGCHRIGGASQDAENPTTKPVRIGREAEGEGEENRAAEEVEDSNPELSALTPPGDRIVHSPLAGRGDV